MSAFVVAPKTISSVVDIIAKYEPIEDRNLLAKRLYLLNVESVNQRYRLKDSECEDRRKEYKNYLANAEKIQYFEQPERHPAQHVQATRCWMYQSCEGDCDRDPLFRAIDKITEKVACDIASELVGHPVSVESDASHIIYSFIESEQLAPAWD